MPMQVKQFTHMFAQEFQHVLQVWLKTLTRQDESSNVTDNLDVLPLACATESRQQGSCQETQAF
jgi:hypothetical protein